LSTVLSEARNTVNPVYIKVDDTVCEKKVPSSKAKNPTEGSGWYYSHLEIKCLQRWYHAVNTTFVTVCRAMKKGRKRKSK